MLGSEGLVVTRKTIRIEKMMIWGVAIELREVISIIDILLMLMVEDDPVQR